MSQHNYRLDCTKWHTLILKIFVNFAVCQ